MRKDQTHTVLNRQMLLIGTVSLCTHFSAIQPPVQLAALANKATNQVIKRVERKMTRAAVCVAVNPAHDPSAAGHWATMLRLLCV